MSTEVEIEDTRWQQAGLTMLAKEAVQGALAYLSFDQDDYEVIVLGCDDARIAALNSDFRDKPQPTNVLSWPSRNLAAKTDGDDPVHPAKGPRGADEGGEIELGDIAIAFETCAQEAKEQGKSFDQHVTHLVVHGVLHLLGYDHIRDKDATLMEAHERAILGKLGLPDPYVH